MCVIVKVFVHGSWSSHGAHLEKGVGRHRQHTGFEAIAKLGKPRL